MNYLAHYYLDHTDPRPHFTLGLVLPDLVRNFQKQYRLNPLHLTDAKPADEMLHLNQGVHRHFHADKVFHTSTFFDQQNSELKRKLYAAGFESINKYIYFVAHVLLEMVIDRVLIQQHPLLCFNFYDALEKTDKLVIGNYLQISGKFTNEHSEQFLLYFSQFCKSQYLFHYRHNDGLLYGLERMYQRYVPGVFSVADKEKLVVIIEQTEESIAPLLTILFAEEGIFG
jgi:hypothetical protein